MTIHYSNDLFEKRWLAQDTLGNVWLLGSSSVATPLQKAPTLLLPAVGLLADSWHSWPEGFFIPSDHVIGVNGGQKVRVGGLGALKNVISLLLNREHTSGQKEIFAKGMGLVQISLP